MRSYLKDMREARFEAVPPEHDLPWILAALGPRCWSSPETSPTARTPTW